MPKKFILIAMAIMVLSSPVFADSWWNSEYKNRTPLTLDLNKNKYFGIGDTLDLNFLDFNSMTIACNDLNDLRIVDHDNKELERIILGNKNSKNGNIFATVKTGFGSGKHVWHLYSNNPSCSNPPKKINSVIKNRSFEPASNFNWSGKTGHSCDGESCGEQPPQYDNSSSSSSEYFSHEKHSWKLYTYVYSESSNSDPHSNAWVFQKNVDLNNVNGIRTDYNSSSRGKNAQIQNQFLLKISGEPVHEIFSYPGKQQGEKNAFDKYLFQNKLNLTDVNYWSEAYINCCSSSPGESELTVFVDNIITFSSVKHSLGIEESQGNSPDVNFLKPDINAVINRIDSNNHIIAFSYSDLDESQQMFAQLGWHYSDGNSFDNIIISDLNLNNSQNCNDFDFNTATTQNCFFDWNSYPQKTTQIFIDLKVFDLFDSNYVFSGPFFTDFNSPTLQIFSPDENETIETENVLVQFDANDSCGLQKFLIKLNDKEWIDKGLEKQHLFENVENGKHVVIVQSFDLCSNDSNKSVNFFVQVPEPEPQPQNPPSPPSSGGGGAGGGGGGGGGGLFQKPNFLIKNTNQKEIDVNFLLKDNQNELKECVFFFEFVPEFVSFSDAFFEFEQKPLTFSVSNNSVKFDKSFCNIVETGEHVVIFSSNENEWIVTFLNGKVFDAREKNSFEFVKNDSGLTGFFVLPDLNQIAWPVPLAFILFLLAVFVFFKKLKKTPVKKTENPF